MIFFTDKPTAVAEEVIFPVNTLISHAIERGWVRYPKPAPPVQPYTLSRQERYAMGLTARGTPRKRRATISPAIIAEAKRDGVGVTAIYNRIKRKGRLTK